MSHSYNLLFFNCLDQIPRETVTFCSKFLIFEREENELNSEKNIQIIEKQLRGFISGNNIKFPIILDRNGVFSDLNLDSSDTALILFDIQKRIIKKYKLPLTTEQLNEISRDKEK